MNILNEIYVDNSGHYIAVIEINNVLSPYHGQLIEYETGLNAKGLSRNRASAEIEEMFGLE